MASVDWTPAHSAPALAEGEVHVWRFGTLGHAPADVLSPEENARAQRLRRPAERRRFVAARGALRSVLARYTEQAPAALRFRYGAHGKPHLEGAHGGRCSFSVTHAGDLLLVAVTERDAVGVDVERLRAVRRWQRIAHRHFAPEVCAVLERLDHDAGARGFLHAWTALEAYAKALGGGVYATRSHLPLPWPPAEEGVVLHDAGPGATGGAWTVRVLQPDDDFVATVAVAGEGKRFRFLEGAAR